MRKSFVVGVAVFTVIELVQLILYYQGIDAVTRSATVLISVVCIGIIVELFRSNVPNYRRVIEMGFYLLLVGSVVLSIFFFYAFFIDTNLIIDFVFVGLPCGFLFLIGLFLTFYGLYLKDKAGFLNW
ncbi:MAG: hypothetical protein ACXAEF_00850 [Candidatus Thorarchaeota archaeon]